ncbi:MAG: agmatine deiminase family protein [Solirubrobacterales bacterium]|nr:agmatine deiminase family protein [Solirubrobacterales bacterium]
MPRLPAEWEPHERTLMGWPCRRQLWGRQLEPARADYAAVANAIAEFESVTMIANPGAEAAAARAACSARVEIVELPLDDSWLRDCGPIYVYAEDGRRRAVHFRFNAWGEKFSSWERDAAVGALIAQALGDQVVEAPLVLEGGSIAADGTGTLVTTEQCLLHPNRNPTLSREQIEAELSRFLGTERIVWLAHGLLEDRDTDGHVDLIAAFTRPGTMLVQTAPPDNPNHERLLDNRERLLAAGLEVLELPLLPYRTVDGEQVAAGYLNLYVCNGAVIVPVAGVESDEQAIRTIASAYPQREVVPVPGVTLAYGGGGPHCITQQVPIARAMTQVPIAEP